MKNKKFTSYLLIGLSITYLFYGSFVSEDYFPQLMWIMGLFAGVASSKIGKVKK